jgi:hypothetical protein
VKENTLILKNYLYIINKLFINKEVVIDYKHHTAYIWMGLKNIDIELPYEKTKKLVNIGIFEQDGGSFKRMVYILKDKTQLKQWFEKQSYNNYLNSNDLTEYNSIIQQIERDKIIDKILEI